MAESTTPSLLSVVVVGAAVVSCGSPSPPSLLIEVAGLFTGELVRLFDGDSVELFGGDSVGPFDEELFGLSDGELVGLPGTVGPLVGFKVGEDDGLAGG